jgi:ribosome maturation factor RimP
MRPNVKSVVEELVNPILEDGGFELVDIEYVKEGGNWFLRVFVDKPGGIDIDDCGRISEALSVKLDEKDPITEAYFLEVSSPGAERPLKKPADYYKAVGKNVMITTYEPLEGLKDFEGPLVSYDEETAVVKVGRKSYTITCAKIAGARLAIVF